MNNGIGLNSYLVMLASSQKATFQLEEEFILENF